MKTQSVFSVALGNSVNGRQIYLWTDLYGPKTQELSATSLTSMIVSPPTTQDIRGTLDQEIHTLAFLTRATEWETVAILITDKNEK